MISYFENFLKSGDAFYRREKMHATVYYNKLTREITISYRHPWSTPGADSTTVTERELYARRDLSVEAMRSFVSSLESALFEAQKMQKVLDRYYGPKGGDECNT